MADGVVLNAGSGGVTALTDETAAGHAQVVKLALSADGSSTLILADANGMEVQGAGTAGTPAGGVVSVQGVASGTVLPVSDGGGNLSIDDGGNTITVDGTVAVTNSDITALAGAVRAEDAASADGHTGLVILATRKGTPANVSGTDGDYEMLQMSAGRLWASATIDAALPAGANAIGKLAANSGVDIGDVDVTSIVMPTGASAAQVQGTIAHDGADGQNPIKIGFRADTTFQTAVSDGDRVDALADVYGVQNIRNDHPNKWFHNTNGSSALTDTEIAAAPGAGLSNYLTDLIISSGAATAMNAFIEEGSTKKLGNYYLEAIAGRSLHIRFATPYKGTANTALTVTTSAAIAHTVTASGFIAP